MGVPYFLPITYTYDYDVTGRLEMYKDGVLAEDYGYDPKNGISRVGWVEARNPTSMYTAGQFLQTV
ncbi:MAG: hypothetical protein GY795_02065 [Desulfobacterales bacterium]|nr:hypothetical protein [Desulfobacterales bacterium]